MKKLIIFDLDHTLINCDSCDGWVRHICRNKLLHNWHQFEQTQNEYNRLYQQGMIYMPEYFNFLLNGLKHIQYDCLQSIIDDYIENSIKPNIYEKGEELIRRHLDQGDDLLLISATIEDLVKPIGEHLGFEPSNIIATKTEKSNNYLTGRTIGELSFNHGKIKRLKQWRARQHQHRYKEIHFYSDSINDLPLLEMVDVPVATNPCDKLKQVALEKGWHIYYFRQLIKINYPDGAG